MTIPAAEFLKADPLSCVLDLYRLRAHVFAQARLCGGSVLRETGEARALFHVLGHGQAWLHAPGLHQGVLLGEGDMVVLPHGAAHELRAPRRQTSASPNCAAPAAMLLCGYFDFMDRPDNPILRALPDVLIVRGADLRAGRVSRILHMLLAEAEQEGAGSQLVLNRLSDVLLVELIRHHLEEVNAPSGFLAAIADARLRPVLDSIHRHLGKNWQVAQLARIASMSRTAFAVRFNELVGTPPLSYLTRCACCAPSTSCAVPRRPSLKSQNSSAMPQRLRSARRSNASGESVPGNAAAPERSARCVCCGLHKMPAGLNPACPVGGAVSSHYSVWSIYPISDVAVG